MSKIIVVFEKKTGYSKRIIIIIINYIWKQLSARYADNKLVITIDFVTFNKI